MKTLAEIKDRIVEIVKSTTGIKLMELIGRDEIVDEVIPALSTWNDLHRQKVEFSELIDDLVVDKRLVEVEYVLPPGEGVVEGRIKSFLLPANTEIILRGGYIEGEWTYQTRSEKK